MTTTKSMTTTTRPATKTTTPTCVKYSKWCSTLQSFIKATTSALKATHLLSLLTITLLLTTPSSSLDTGDVTILVEGKARNSTLIRGQHARHINVLVTQHNTTTTLDLFLNTVLLSSSFVERVVGENCSYHRHPNQSEEFCYYVGSVRGESDSSAAFSTCPSLRGFWRVAEKTWRLADLQEGAYQILLESNNNIATSFCGLGEPQKRFSSTHTSLPKKLRRRRAVVQDYFEDMLVMELYLANDVTRYEQYGGKDIDSVFRSSKEIANIANILYQPLGMMVVLVGVEVWKDRNKIQVSKDSSVTLNNWMAYRGSQVPLYNDVGFLITRTDFGESEFGKSAVDAMCSQGESAGVIRALDDRSQVTASILAHHIGHVFGLKHDTQDCQCEDYKCVMDEKISTTRGIESFSSCSKDQLRRSFAKGSNICLHNSPHSLKLYLAVCGNGILEEGEQCDCGRMPSHMCNQKCCDSDTCRLKGKCAQGACCDVDSCSLRGQGHVCRAERAGSCDLAESCDGSTSSCPTDIFVHDATACTAHNKEASCFGGVCQSRESQCKLLYGGEATDGLDDCYNYNTQGSVHGYCQYNLKFAKGSKDVFYACLSRDIFCGALQCQSNKMELAKYQKFRTKSNKIMKGSACNSIIFDLGKQVLDPGFVPNGSPCGSDLICLNQKCVDRRRVMAEASCSKCVHGRCSSKGECHCNAGVTGLSCDNVLPQGLIVGLFIFFLILTILIALLIYDYKHKQHFINYFKSLEGKYKSENTAVGTPFKRAQGPGRTENAGHDNSIFCMDLPQVSVIPTRAVSKPSKVKPTPPSLNQKDYNNNYNNKYNNSSKPRQGFDNPAMMCEELSAISLVPSKPLKPPSSKAPTKPPTGAKPTVLPPPPPVLTQYSKSQAITKQASKNKLFDNTNNHLRKQKPLRPAKPPVPLSAAKPPLSAVNQAVSKFNELQNKESEY